MPRSTADWPAIRRRYEAGLSAPAIERELPKLPDGRPMVTRQAIIKRARKEGWLRGVAVVPHSGSAGGSKGVPPGSDLEPAELAELVASHAAVLGARLVSLGKVGATVPGIEQALRTYADGGGHTVAAASAGVSADSWERWRNELPELQQAISQIQASKARRHLARIDAAGARGDWKADEAMLRANPLVRDEWGAGAKGSGFMGIQINFGPSMPAEALRVIDE